MIDMSTLPGVVRDFAKARNLTVVPAVPDPDVGPQIHFPPATVSLAYVLELAVTMGCTVLYLEVVPFDPDDHADVPAALREHNGRPMRVTVAFAANGVCHFRQQDAPWYSEWQDDLMDTAEPWPPHTGDTAARREAELRAQEGEQRVDERVNGLLGDPDYRAASPPRRDRWPDTHMSGTHDDWAAARRARPLILELTRAHYDQLIPDPDANDALAEQLLAEPDYRRASSAAGRKRVTAQFLMARADGLAPFQDTVNELYLRTARLSKANKDAPTLL